MNVVQVPPEQVSVRGWTMTVCILNLFDLPPQVTKSKRLTHSLHSESLVLFAKLLTFKRVP